MSYLRNKLNDPESVVFDYYVRRPKEMWNREEWVQSEDENLGDDDICASSKKTASRYESEETYDSVEELGACRLILWLPVSVVKPERVRFHRIAVLVPVPAVVGVGSVLDIENRVPEARFTVSWVLRLRLSHAAARNGVACHWQLFCPLRWDRRKVKIGRQCVGQ